MKVNENQQTILILSFAYSLDQSHYGPKNSLSILSKTCAEKYWYRDWFRKLQTSVFSSLLKFPFPEKSLIPLMQIGLSLIYLFPASTCPSFCEEEKENDRKEKSIKKQKKEQGKVRMRRGKNAGERICENIPLEKENCTFSFNCLFYFCLSSLT